MNKAIFPANKLMVLFYTEKISERINYICHFILKEQLGVDFTITTDIKEVESSHLPVINYSQTKLNNDVFQVIPQGLLNERYIEPKIIDCFTNEHFIAFFKQKESAFPFDIFSASFYLLSRYEEYLPHQQDEYGRFPFTASIAFKNNFLQLPLINMWIEYFSDLLKIKFPNLHYFKPAFKCILTYDIDMAWSYRKKGWLRNIGGFIKKPSLNRLSVLLDFEKDPFDSYSFMEEMNKKSNTDAVYFFLMANRLSRYDKNISPRKSAMKTLIQTIAKQSSIGLHPSWRSFKNSYLIQKEKKKLEKMSGEMIANSRQHYIKMTLPDTYRNLIESGISNDFSMGYGSTNGYRASFAGSFYWYDLATEKTTSLRIFPFCFMDANSHYEQEITPEAALIEIKDYLSTCKQYNGLFIPIFHNNFLGSDQNFKGWKEMYANFISQLLQ